MIKNILSKMLSELARVSPFILLSLILLWGDDGYHVILYAIGISVAFAVVSHFIRRTFFPYLDTKQLLNNALKEPLASAVAFAGICYLLAIVFQSSLSLLK